jgi:glycosyltransferase involved in cell wall biosynthesis
MANSSTTNTTTARNSAPSVSVIIPTHNRAALVVDAISSCLAQGLPETELEIVVVDDGSTDDTVSVLEKLSRSVCCLPFSVNQGRNRARNAGLAHSRGDYVKFLDSDDVLESGSLQTELAAARAADADIVVSGWRCVKMRPDGGERLIARFDAPFMEPVIDRLLAGRAVPTSAALYSRALVGELHWDEGLRKLDDWDWFIRTALRARKIARLDITSYTWRDHRGQGVRAETMLFNALEHHRVLGKLEAALLESGKLTDARRRRLAQYYYKELRVLCLGDKSAFDRAVRHIHELDPGFVPRDEERQWWMRALCRVFGVRIALSLHSGIKTLVKPRAGKTA